LARAYLDHASTSPLRPEGVQALMEWIGAADPGRMHTEGRAARVAHEDARSRLAEFFGTRSRSVIFTSGATEAIHAAVHGAVRDSRGTHIVSPLVEHAAVRQASERDAQVTWIAVDHEGRVDPEAVLDAIGPTTALVHCQLANHEVGTLQPVAHIVAGCRERGVLVHVDAAAAAGHLPVAFDDLGADLLSVSAHKMGGPRGIGALLVRRGLRLPALLVGGDQERARRAGLEDVAAAWSWAAVASLLSGGGLVEEATRAVAQTQRLRRAAAAIPGITCYGPTSAAGRLPSLVCLGIDGVEAEGVLLGLDQAGVAAHSGSACASESLEPSPVLAAMGAPDAQSLRLSVGWSTTNADIDLAIAALPEVVARLRALAAPA
jgi:cysteine desulfurase